MEKITAASPEAQSADLVAGNIEQLKALFPELITEGPNGTAVNVDVLKALVGDRTVTDADEKYGLNWHGKRRARQLALTPSTGTLRPCPDESVDWDTTQNLMIEGDNLEVLKLLQKSYAGKVKLIYIDPPYNTGKDFVYPDNFQDNIRNYLALTQPEGSQWSGNCKQSALELRMFSVRQPYPMLMAARRKLESADFEALLRATVVIAFRYNVIGAQHTGEQERHYHAAALRLHRGEATTLAQVLDVLKPIYRGDEAFRTDFSEKSIKTTQTRNAKVVRYILYKLERQADGLDFDRDSPAYNIEHVLPQSPGAGWEVFSDRDLDAFIYRLSNMVMLESSVNRDIGNGAYAEKRDALRASAVSLTRRLAEENDDWTPERLQARQKQLANLATTVWRVAQLS